MELASLDRDFCTVRCRSFEYAEEDALFIRTKFHEITVKLLLVPVAAPSKAWDCGFESQRQHGRLSVVSVVCRQVEFCATS